MTGALEAAESAASDGSLRLDLVEITAAILLVASGRTPRVTIVNLRRCRAAVRALGSLAAEQGVQLDLVPRLGGPDCDLVISRE